MQGNEFAIYFVTLLELEWMLGQAEAIPTKIKEDPRPKVNDVLFSSLKNGNNFDDGNDW